jgi:Pectinacetylesterase
MGCVVAATVLPALGACGSSSSNETPAADAGAKEEASAATPDAARAPDAAPIDKTAILNLQSKTWQFVPIEGAMCRDGSATGIGVNVNPDSKNLMIYLEGGGACFNALTCAGNPSSFSEADFNACTGSAGGTCAAASITGGGAGILNRSDTANPMADWNFVYVPFCTGDVHAGNKLNATVTGVAGKQQFVGYANMTRYLARLVPTFPGLSKVLLTGVSAGGFGAAANYLQTAKAFGSVPVYDLDDSGPPMEDPYVPSCLQKQWADTWGFESTILADCGSACPDPTNYTLDASIHVAKMYPNIPFGLIEDTDDEVITLFYGFGANNCAAAAIPTPVTGPMFTQGLLDSRTKLAPYPNFGGFIFQGTDHTTLGGASYDTRTAGSGDAAVVKLSDWVTTLVNSGTVTNVGP